MDELPARLRAVRRRGTPGARTAPSVVTESFTVHLDSKKVTKNGETVHLTPTEWRMLARNRGKLVGRREILHEVWGPDYTTETHYLRVYLETKPCLGGHERVTAAALVRERSALTPY